MDKENESVDSDLDSTEVDVDKVYDESDVDISDDAFESSINMIRVSHIDIDKEILDNTLLNEILDYESNEKLASDIAKQEMLELKEKDPSKIAIIIRQVRNSIGGA